MLTISETIVQDKNSKGGRLLSNFIFETLNHAITSNADVSNTGFSICQGWLDIMINAKVGRTQDPVAKSIFVTMTVEEVAQFFDKATNFLVSALNYGTFEGSAGSTRRTVMKLNLALDLLVIAFNVKLPDQ